MLNRDIPSLKSIVMDGLLQHEAGDSLLAIVSVGVDAVETAIDNNVRYEQFFFRFFIAVWCGSTIYFTFYGSGYCLIFTSLFIVDVTVHFPYFGLLATVVYFLRCGSL